MNILENLRFTINSIFDLYANHLKRIYTVSLSFAIASNIIALLISAVVLLVIMSTMNIKLSVFDSKIEEFVFNGITTARFTTLCKTLILLSAGIFGIYILRNESLNFEEKPSLNAVSNSLSRGEWETFALLASIGILINAFLYQDVLSTPASWSGNAYNYNSESATWKFYAWINSMVELAKDLLAYFLTMLFVLSALGNKITLENIKKYKYAFASAFLLCFCFEVLSSTVILYFKTYIMQLIEIPFSMPVFPGIAYFLFMVLSVAFFGPAIACTIIYPFKYEADKFPAE